MGWVFDLDGVIWRGQRPIAGSADAVAELVARGEDVVFVTNMSARGVREVEGALYRQGIDATGRVVTSAQAAASLLEPGERAVVCAGPGVTEALVERGIEVVAASPADAVVVGFHTDFDYRRLTVAMRAVRDGARLVATNDDPVYPTDEGLLPGGGAIVAAVATASGVVPVVAGKPHAPMCLLVRERLGPQGWVVGDRCDTDGAFARALGYRFALVLSGVTGPEDLPGDPAPDLVGADAASVVRDLLAEG